MTMEFDLSAYSVNEPRGSVNVCVSVKFGVVLEREVVVQYQTANQSAKGKKWVDRLYMYIKKGQRSKDAAAKKRPNTSGVGKINNYYEYIYIPPYNNTDSPHLYIVTIPIDSTH